MCCIFYCMHILYILLLYMLNKRCLVNESDHKISDEKKCEGVPTVWPQIKNNDDASAIKALMWPKSRREERLLSNSTEIIYVVVRIQ